MIRSFKFEVSLESTVLQVTKLTAQGGTAHLEAVTKSLPADGQTLSVRVLDRNGSETWSGEGLAVEVSREDMPGGEFSPPLSRIEYRLEGWNPELELDATGG